MILWITNFRVSFFFANAYAKVSGPNRPANIVMVTIIFPIGDNSLVNPIERPVVLNAEVASNNTSKKCSSSIPSVMVNNKATMRTQASELTTTANARMTVSIAIRRWNTWICPPPRKVLIVANIRTTKVFVFIPPPVPPDDAPMNMSIIRSS